MATDTTEPTSLPPEAPADEVESSSALRTVFGLFVVPLAVVLLCVGVFLGFGWIAYERQTIGDYLNDMRSGWGHRRWQAAYELSKVLVADPQAIAQEPGAAAELRRLFVESKELRDERVRRYLALVLGRVGDREALPLLLGALDDTDAETRIYAIWSLGALGDPAASPALVARLDDADAGIRKTAAFALGRLGDPAMAEHLTPLLGDSVADVRWNAALALAALGDVAAVPELERMLDRRLLAKVPEITPEQQEDAMLGAIPALARLSGTNALPLFDELVEGDPSRKVRQAAIEARRQLGG